MVRTGDHCIDFNGDPAIFIQGFRRKKLPYRLDDIFVYGHSGAFEFGSVFFRNESVPNITFTFIIGMLNSGAFLVATMTHIEALKRLPSSVVYSIIRLNVVVVVLFSIFYKEK